MIQRKILSDYAPLQQLPSRDNDKKPARKGWANPKAAWIPPDGGAGCGQGKYFPGCRSGHVSLGVALSVLLKMLRVVQSTRWADKKVPLQGWKL